MVYLTKHAERNTAINLTQVLTMHAPKLFKSYTGGASWAIQIDYIGDIEPQLIQYHIPASIERTVDAVNRMTYDWEQMVNAFNSASMNAPNRSLTPPLTQ